jgi:cytochrome P450
LHDTIMEWAGGRHYLPEDATVKALAASAELNEMLLPYVRQRRDHPRQDMISSLWQEAPGLLEAVSEEDILATCREFYLGGSDTTVHALANALYLLLSDPQTLAAVQGDATGQALSNFIEEVMRYLGSVQYRYRIANQAIDIAGVAIKANEVLFTINAAANRDPVRFQQPERIDLQRARPRDHIAFNTGPRMCVGAGLARAEIRIALDMLFQELPHLRLDSSQPAASFTGFFTRSYRPLHVIWG